MQTLTWCVRFTAVTGPPEQEALDHIAPRMEWMARQQIGDAYPGQHITSLAPRPVEQRTSAIDEDAYPVILFLYDVTLD